MGASAHYDNDTLNSTSLQVGIVIEPSIDCCIDWLIIGLGY